MLVQVFTEARVFFSLDGERYQQTPLYFSLDTKGEDDWFRDPPPHKDVGGNSRNVTIPLQNRVGRFVRVELEFSTKWILLSEVYFDSGKYSQLFGVNSCRCKKPSVDSISDTPVSLQDEIIAHINSQRS